ncbi:MAG: hypothetical protein IPF41_13095 [Flavobacteriales bacterium]|nr:hypothetical protein [Flavobacteriales bacterium]
MHRARSLRTSAWLERVLVERLERKTAHVDSLFR